MRRHTELAGTVHANAPEILLEIENLLVKNNDSYKDTKILSSEVPYYYWFTQDDDFSLVVPGQPECKREEFKVRYPLFREKVMRQRLSTSIYFVLISAGGQRRSTCQFSDSHESSR